jgi:hypothetical protein
MQVDPAGNIGLRHTAAAADALGHLTGQRFDVGSHDFGGLGSSQNAWFRPEIPVAWDIAESRAIG